MKTKYGKNVRERLKRRLKDYMQLELVPYNEKYDTIRGLNASHVIASSYRPACTPYGFRYVVSHPRLAKDWFVPTMFSVETATSELLFRVAKLSGDQTRVVGKTSTITLARDRTEPLLIRKGYTNWKAVAECKWNSQAYDKPVKRRRRPYD